MGLKYIDTDSYIECMLMHKDVPVANCLMDSATGEFIKVLNIVDFDHIPLNAISKGSVVTTKDLKQWWKDRGIPVDRTWIDSVLQRLGVTIPVMLQKSLGLSLSDHYWMKPKDAEIKWADVNFYDNAFEEDLGWLLMGSDTAIDSDKISFMTPDAATNGCLPKGWHIVNGERLLFKTSSTLESQQAFNEVIAAELMELMGIPHADYQLRMIDNKPVCVTPDICNQNVEFIPMIGVFGLQKQLSSVNLYQHTINCCKLLGCDDVQTKLDQMIVVDYLLRNEDRHCNNFGLIRNPDTLEILGFAPLFDSGTSLWMKHSLWDSGTEKFECKPFRNQFDKQLELVKDMSWFDPDKLNGFTDRIMEILNSLGPEIIQDAQKERIITGFEHNLRKVINHANSLASASPGL